MRIIFMGTPDFAVATLSALVKNNFNVVAVVTAPDKPTGRGQKLSESPVKKFALECGIPILQPEKLRNSDFIKELASFNAELQVVVAFRMLPEIVWNMPSKGTINLHASLLPQYRGAAPINWAIINGETQTGLTTFFIEKEIDTGNIIFAEKIEIGENEDAGSLHDRMMEVGSQLMIKTLKAIEIGEYPSIPQDFSKELKSAPKIFKETCKIDWNQDSSTIFNFIRGLSPYPAAWTMLGDKLLKIYEAQVFTEDMLDFLKIENTANATVLSDLKNELLFKTKNGYIAAKQVQLEGKKRMLIEDFLRGYNFLK